MIPDEYELGQSTGYLIGHIAAEMKKMFARAVEGYGVTTQQCAPLIILYRGNGSTPTEIAQTAGIDVGGVSRLLDRLEDKGLVKRVSGGEDRRSVRIKLTKEGRRLAPKLLKVSYEMNNNVFGEVLGKKRARELHKTLEGVLEQLTLSSLAEHRQSN